MHLEQRDSIAAIFIGPPLLRASIANYCTRVSAFEWSPEEYLDDATVQNPEFMIPTDQEEEAITYVFELTITDANGCVVQSTPDGAPGIQVINPAAVSHPATITGHPNPFTDQVILGYHLPESETVSLVITDIYGEIVEELLWEEEELAGLHQLSWDTGDLLPGIYVYTLYQSTDVVSLKMIKL